MKDFKKYNNPKTKKNYLYEYKNGALSLNKENIIYINNYYKKTTRIDVSKVPLKKINDVVTNVKQKLINNEN